MEICLELSRSGIAQAKALQKVRDAKVEASKGPPETNDTESEADDVQATTTSSPDESMILHGMAIRNESLLSAMARSGTGTVLQQTAATA